MPGILTLAARSPLDTGCRHQGHLSSPASTSAHTRRDARSTVRAASQLLINRTGLKGTAETEHEVRASSSRAPRFPAGCQSRDLFPR